MAKYRYICPACGKDKTIFASKADSLLACQCGHSMVRQPPSIGKSEMKEVADKYTNIHLPADNDEILKERKLDHFWSVEVPRLVNEYPLEHSLEEGWMYFDESGKLQVHTKPPHKR